MRWLGKTLGLHGRGLICRCEVRKSMFWTIHSMGLSHSLDNLSSEQARPMYSTKIEWMGQRPKRSTSDWDLGLLTKFSSLLHKIFKSRQLFSIIILLPHGLNWIISFEILDLSNVADKLSSKWAGPYTRRLSRSLFNPSSKWAASSEWFWTPIRRP